MIARVGSLALMCSEAHRLAARLLFSRFAALEPDLDPLARAEAFRLEKTANRLHRDEWVPRCDHTRRLGESFR